MSFIPPFDPRAVFLSPWSDNLETIGWIALMGFLVTAACGLIGNYLILRRMALVGDAISHSILPGIAIAFLIAKSRSSLAMFAGALVAGIVTTLLIETIHRRSRVKQDAAIGIVFSTLFAIGVILITLFASQVDLDQDCVLYGDISFVWMHRPVMINNLAVPEPVLVMGIVTIAVVALIALFYKELLVSSFDTALSASLGINPTIMHYSLMSALSIVVVSAFQSVGAILVIAMLILPGATAYLLTERLSAMLILSTIHSALSSLIGLHLGIWLNCSIAAAMVVAGGGLFCAAWVFSPRQGLLPSLLRRSRSADEAPALATS